MMDEFNFNDELIRIATLINNERILVVDNGTELINEINKRRLEVHITYCDSSDFTTLTQHPEDHVNAFDVVFCPSALYDMQADNRQLVLQFIVWAMKNSSRLIFSIPNINNFLVNSLISWKGSKHTLEEDRMFFKVEQYSSLLKPKTWIRPNREYWHKTTVRFPSQNFKVWNTENPVSQWGIRNMAVKKIDDFIFCMVDMRKSIKNI